MIENRPLKMEAKLMRAGQRSDVDLDAAVEQRHVGPCGVAELFCATKFIVRRLA